MSMTDNTAPVTWLTREAYDRLKAELDDLIENRTAIAPRSARAARRATSGRTAATTPPARSRASRRRGSASCRSCCAPRRSARRPRTRGVAGPGMVVTVRFEDDDESETFLIGSREETGGRPGGLLGRLAAGQGAGRGQGRRDPHVRDAERQDDERHPAEGRAVPRAAEPAAGPHALPAPAGAPGTGSASPGRSRSRCARCPGCATTRSITRCRSALERATIRHSMSPWPVIVCTSSTSRDLRQVRHHAVAAGPCAISSVTNAVTTKPSAPGSSVRAEAGDHARGPAAGPAGPARCRGRRRAGGSTPARRSAARSASSVTSRRIQRVELSICPAAQASTPADCTA